MKSITVRTILVPVDFSECALEALQYGMALAEKFSARVIVLHVIDLSVFSSIEAASVSIPVTEITTTMANRLADWVQLAARQGIEVTWSIEIGLPFTEIREAIDRYHADLVVMGTHGRTGLGHIMLGSVAERVVQRAPCPVLTVKSVPTAATESTTDQKATPKKDVTETRAQVCKLCGKVSPDTICDSCKAKVQAEAMAKKRRVEK